MAKIEVMLTEYWHMPKEFSKRPLRIGNIRAINSIQQDEVNRCVDLMSKSDSFILPPTIQTFEPFKQVEIRKILNTETLTFEDIKNA